jgi:diacylglycerol kinase family enzyme
LQGSDVPMAVFPGGTGNVFARSFYPVPSPEAFVRMVRTGRPQPVDLIEIEYTDVDGAVHNRLCVAGVGFGKLSDAISDATPFYKRIFGKLVYVARVASACLTPGADAFELTTQDGRHETDAMAVFVLNVVPPAMSILSRGCNASDGLLDVVVLSGNHVGHAMSNVFSVLFGRHNRWPPMRTEELTIRCKSPIRPNIDGDPCQAMTCIRLRAKKAAVNVLLSA